MEKELIKYLPSELLILILSRLPPRSIVMCKCVCKSWLNLLGTDEFVKRHLSQSVPCLAVSKIFSPTRYKIYEFNDDLDLEHHNLHYRLLTKCRFPHYSSLQASTNGLLFLHGQYYEDDGLYICNPLTRDYIKLPYPKEFVYSDLKEVAYGFGASKVTGKHKVVRIFQAYVLDNQAYECVRVTKFECHAYTLGTGSWRSIRAGDTFNYGSQTTGPCVNGNLHWLVCDVDGSRLVSCFDVETEVFSTFPSPCHPSSGGFGYLSVLGDCLCFCKATTGDGMIIWVVKDYGVEKCWTKEFVISSFNSSMCKLSYPIKVFRDGDMLMAPFLFCYCAKSEEAQRLGLVKNGSARTVIYSLSFLSLKSFGNENVSSF